MDNLNFAISRLLYLQIEFKKLSERNREKASAYLALKTPHSKDADGAFFGDFSAPSRGFDSSVHWNMAIDARINRVIDGISVTRNVLPETGIYLCDQNLS